MPAAGGCGEGRERGAGRPARSQTGKVTRRGFEWVRACGHHATAGHQGANEGRGLRDFRHIYLGLLVGLLVG